MSQPGEHFLSSEEEQLLLQVARDSLEAFVQRGEHIDVEQYPLTDQTRARRGAFVTLRNRGELRGCIGYTHGIGTLAEAVRDNAVNAAARDPRFSPVTPAELNEITIEISALCPGDDPDSPFIEVKNLDEIVVGLDGLYLDQAGARGGGLLLPQVPVEQGWNLNQFLDGICRKAGAPPQAWERRGATLYRFRAQVFSEARRSHGE